MDLNILLKNIRQHPRIRPRQHRQPYLNGPQRRHHRIQHLRPTEPLITKPGHDRAPKPPVHVHPIAITIAVPITAVPLALARQICVQEPPLELQHQLLYERGRLHEKPGTSASSTIFFLS